MTNESDIQRAEWEGMVPDPKETMSEDLKDFLAKIKEKFDSDENIWGVRDVVRGIIKGFEEKEDLPEEDKNKFFKFVTENFHFNDELSFDSLKKFFDGPGGDILRGYMRAYLGEQEWDKFESEGATRKMRYDQTFGGTPG